MSDTMQRDTVTWDRKTKTGTDAQGTPQYVSAAGFPRSVKCSFQSNLTTSAPSGEGRKPKFDAMVYSDTWFSGLKEDRVTFQGVTYLVNKVGNNGNLSDDCGHATYGLIRG